MNSKDGCKVVIIGDESTAIICGGKSDHEHNNDAVVYETKEARYTFNDEKEADEWYEKNYQTVIAASVACSICGRAAMDDALHMDF